MEARCPVSSPLPSARAASPGASPPAPAVPAVVRRAHGALAPRSAVLCAEVTRYAWVRGNGPHPSAPQVSVQNLKQFLSVPRIQSKYTSPESHPQRFLPAVITTHSTQVAIGSQSTLKITPFLRILVFIDFGEAMMYCIRYEEDTISFFGSSWLLRIFAMETLFLQNGHVLPYITFHKVCFFLQHVLSLLNTLKKTMLFHHRALYLLCLLMQGFLLMLWLMSVEQFLLLTSTSFSAFHVLTILMVVILLYYIPGIYIVNCIYTTMSTSSLL